MNEPPSTSVEGRLLGLLRPYTQPLAVGCACLAVATPLQMFHPLVWMFIVDEVVGKGKIGLLVPALLVMFAVHLTGAAINSARTFVLGRAGQRFVAALRGELHAKLTGQPIAYHHGHRGGDLVSRVIGDAETLQEVVIQGVDNVLGNILSLVWVSGIVLWLQWKAGLITLIPLAIVAFITWIFNARVKGLYRRIRDRLGALSAHVQEHLQAIPVIKAFAREDFERAWFERRNREYMVESFKGVTARAIYFPGVMAVGFLTNVTMIGLGAYFVLRGEFTIGGLIAYRGYWWHLFQPVFSLAQANEMFQRARASAARVFEVLDAPETIADPEEPVEMESCVGRVTFEDVSFAHRPGVPLLEQISIEAQPGQRIGVAGPSGCGKSTLLSLLLRFHDPVQGVVRLDGHDLRALRQTGFRRFVALVGQEPFLFDESILENIRFGRVEATDDEVREAARQANATGFIERLPEGYATRVGERGAKLSGGERQRLCIARAFLANPSVLLLDEATAAVEPESEAQILAALEQLESGRTTFIVSHRLALLRNCQAILVINHGRITEQGTHVELLARGGWYARMHALQSEGGNGEE